MFKKVLIANRGEIAIRIARAAASLGIDTVGVHAPIDAQALHTRLVGTARELPFDPAQGNDPVRAYLDIDAMIAIARDTGCDAVHPGYGFLSENARFAERCRQAGLRFVGPSPDALALFGDKVKSRTFAQSLGVPVVPGASAPLASVDDALSVAGRLGYPVMSAGASDSAFLRRAGIPMAGVSGLFIEAGDYRAHGRDERVRVNALYDSREFMSRLVKELAR